MKIRLVGYLRSVAGSSELSVQLEEPTTLRKVLAELLPDRRLVSVLMKEDGNSLRDPSLILVGGSEMRLLRGLDTAVEEKDMITVIPTSHGGQGRVPMKFFEIGSHCIGIGFVNSPFERILMEPKETTIRINEAIAPCSCQFFDASKVAGTRHVLAGFANALAASEAKRTVSRDLTVETLVRMSAQTQIRGAVEMLGVSPETREIGMLIIGPSEEDVKEAHESVSQEIGGTPRDAGQLSSERARTLMELYGVETEEIDSLQAKTPAEAVVLAILDRIASVDLYR